MSCKRSQRANETAITATSQSEACPLPSLACRTYHHHRQYFDSSIFFKSFDVLANNNNVVIMMGHLGNIHWLKTVSFFCENLTLMSIFIRLIRKNIRLTFEANILAKTALCVN